MWLTRHEVAQCTADSLRIVSGPIGVGYGAPRSVEENFHTSFPLVGPADKAQVAVPELSGHCTAQQVTVDYRYKLTYPAYYAVDRVGEPG